MEGCYVNTQLFIVVNYFNILIILLYSYISLLYSWHVGLHKNLGKLVLVRKRNYQALHGGIGGGGE